MKFMIWVLAIVSSLGAHAALISGFEGREREAVGVSENAYEATPDEQAAVLAFAELDEARRFDAVMDEVIAQIPKVDFSDVKFPIEAEPQEKPKEIAKPKPVEKSVPKPKAAPMKPVQAAPKKAEQAGYSDSVRAKAKADYGAQIRYAIGQALRVPRNVGGVNAVLAVSFQNGKLTGYSLAQSSGNAQFDQAVLSAVKSARFPSPHPATPAAVNYQLTLAIQ